MDKEQRFFESRIKELSNKAFLKNIYTYSDFLNLYEQNIFGNMLTTLPPIKYELVGGNVFAERKIICFSPVDIYYDEEPPVSVIRIEPANSRFSDDLTHRDFLGAIMNLGIERSKIGDILVRDNEAYVYCLDTVKDYMAENIQKIKHTTVKCYVEAMKSVDVRPKFKEMTGTVNNIRLDAVISVAFNTSRSSIVSCISEGKVFVNGKLITSNGYKIKEDDIISVRGLGRCIFKEHISVTKKGRNMIKVLKYV